MNRFAMRGVILAAMLAAASSARAIDAKTALDKIGFPSDTATKVLAGEFVETALPTTTERDLNVGVAFLIKESPEAVTKKLREDRVLQKVDPATRAFGNIEGEGTLEQLAGLKLTAKQVKAYGAAEAGGDLNLSSEEIAALRSAGKDAAAVQAKVHELLLARYRAYRAKGVAGIAPYDRGGSKRDASADLASVNAMIRKGGLLTKDFYDLLDNYPNSVPANLNEIFYWTQFEAHGEDTIALVHAFQGTFGGNLIAVQRQFYVSTGYNVEQAVVGFLPAKDDTLVIYTNHTSTDQVGGFGGGAKRSIGRKFMASELTSLFEKTREAVAK